MSVPSTSSSNDNKNDATHIEEEVDGEHCCICLDLLLDRTVIPECSHEFCFECLLTWSEQSRKCPLCTRQIGAYLIHHIRSNLDFQKYYLPPQSTSPLSSQQSRQESRVLRSRRTAQSRRWGRTERRAQEAADELERAIDRRRWIYQNRLFAKHVASNTFTRYRPFPTPAQFSASQDQISRATIFIRRELRVWSDLDIEFLTTFILSLMKAIDIRCESAVKLLAELLDMEIPYREGNRYPNAEHFIHGHRFTELYSFIRSPYKSLSAYDANVEYDTSTNDTDRSIGYHTTTGIELRRINEMAPRRLTPLDRNQDPQSSRLLDGSDFSGPNLNIHTKSPIDCTQPGTISLQASVTTTQNFTDYGASHSQESRSTGLTATKGKSLQANSNSHLISDTGSPSCPKLGVQNTKGKQREHRSTPAGYGLATNDPDHVGDYQRMPNLTVSKDKYTHPVLTEGPSFTKEVDEGYKHEPEAVSHSSTIQDTDISDEQTPPATEEHEQRYRTPLMIVQAHLKSSDNKLGQIKPVTSNLRNTVHDALRRRVEGDDLIHTRNTRSDIASVEGAPSLLRRISGSIDLLSRSEELPSFRASGADNSGNIHCQDNLRHSTEQPLSESNDQNLRSRLLQRLESEKERANQALVNKEAEKSRSVIVASRNSDIPCSDLMGVELTMSQYPSELLLENKLRSRIKLKRKLAIEKQGLVGQQPNESSA